MTTIIDLYNSLKQRKRPEDVAQMVIELMDERLSAKELSVLEKAAKGSLSKNSFAYTSMMQEFAKATGADKQIKKAIEIFQLQSSAVDYSNANNIETFIKETSPIIYKTYGDNDFKSDRLNKSQRLEVGLELSKRNYNKKWRLLKRLERKLLATLRENRKNEFQMISKHGLIHHLDYDNFSLDLNTACFIAYYNSRCNLRSVFTNQSQKRPFDEICEMLLDRCENKKSIFGKFFRSSEHDEPTTTNWWAISQIYPTPKVLAHLSDEQKGKLFGQWTTILQDIAELLDEIWSKSDINKQTMIVKKGNDSTTWNNTAGAWNKARDSWMNLTYALGLEYLLDDICFGKVMRLMAVDVAAWHRLSGGKLDPNTEVWNKLPLPWQVFSGNEACTKKMIVQLCNEAGLDSEKSGWVTPRIHGVSEFKPTPELVHGVTITNPFLATVLKQHKYFSGKKHEILIS